MNHINLIENEKGATLVETAIIILIFLGFIFAIIDLGLLLFNKQVLTNASREGARAGIVMGLNRSDPAGTNYYVDEFESAAFAFCTNYLVNFGSNVPSIVSPYYIDNDGNGLPSRGDDLTLRLRYNYDFLFLPLPAKQLNAITIMKLE